MKLTLVGNTLTIMTDFKLVDITQAEVLKPSVLIAKDEEGNQMYRIARSNSSGQLATNGAVLNVVDSEGFLGASVTMPMDVVVNKQSLMVNFGEEILALKTYETAINAAIHTAISAVESLFDSLEV